MSFYIFSRICSKINFVDLVSSVWDELTQMVNFATLIPGFDSNSPAFSDLFISSDPSIRSTTTFLQLGNSDHIFVCFYWFYFKLKRECLVLSDSFWLFSCWLGRSSWSFERCTMEGLNYVLLLILLNFVSECRL